MIQSLKQLKAKEKRLIEAVEKENAKTIRVMKGIGWGAGMRRTKVSPSFSRLDELETKLKIVKQQIENFKEDRYETERIIKPCKK